MTFRAPVLLIGCGGHSRSIIDVIDSDNKWKVIGLIGLPEQIGNTILGYKVIGGDNDLPRLKHKAKYAMIALGQIPNSANRRRMARMITNLGFKSPIIISPYAVVSKHAKLGPGTFIGHGAIVNAGAVVGLHCTLNTMSLIEHDVSVGDHCHISTGALVNGGVKIGQDSFIGSGSVIRDGIDLPNGSIISARKRVMGWPLLYLLSLASTITETLL